MSDQKPCDDDCPCRDDEPSPVDRDKAELFIYGVLGAYLGMASTLTDSRYIRQAKTDMAELIPLAAEALGVSREEVLDVLLECCGDVSREFTQRN